MGRGLLSGLFWGGAASMVALIIASLYFPMRDLANRQAEDTVRTEVERAETTPGRPLLADPPPPAPAAEVADAAPADPAPVPGTEPAPEIETRTENPPAEIAQAAPLSPPSIPEEPQGVPDVPDTASRTVTPQSTSTPPSLEASAPESTASEAPASPAANSPSEAFAARPTIPQTPDAGAAPVTEAAPLPTTLPEPEAVDDLPEPSVAPAPSVPAQDSRLALAAIPAPLPELPERPAGPVPPGAPGSSPMPDLSQILTPAVIGETPVADSEAAKADPIPNPTGFAPFAPPVSQDAPATPELRLSALTRPITEGPPAPREAPELQPDLAPTETAPEDEGGVEVAPETAPIQDAPPQEDRVAGLQTAPRPSETVTERSLPRRIVVGGATDGVSRLTANRLGAGSRLPQIGAVDEVPEAVTPEPSEGSPDAALGALARNAQPWEGAGAPTAVVLQATSADRSIADILAGISAPLSVALDPSWPDAPARAATLREAGHEVLITLTGLPPRPRARDIDVALNAHIARLPEAVGVFLPSDAPIGNDRDLLSHLATRLSQTGHGLVAEPRGLNVLDQIARSEGAALASIDSVLSSQQPQTQTTRALDRAVFDASRAGTFVVLAQTQADILIALQNWTQASGENLAPVSAIMLAGS